MNEVRIVHFVCWVIIFALVMISWDLKSEKAARILLGVAIEITFIYASFYGRMMS